MGKRIKEPVGAHEIQPVSLSELIHQHVRVAIETAPGVVTSLREGGDELLTFFRFPKA